MAVKAAVEDLRGTRDVFWYQLLFFKYSPQFHFLPFRPARLAL